MTDRSRLAEALRVKISGNIRSSSPSSPLTGREIGKLVMFGYRERKRDNESPEPGRRLNTSYYYADERRRQNERRERITERATALRNEAAKKRARKRNWTWTIVKWSSIGLLLFLILAYISLPSELCSDVDRHANLTGLEKVLKESVFGQHLVVETAFRLVKAHVKNPHPVKPLVLSLHGSMGNGKNFVSTIVADHLFPPKSRFVHKVIVSLEFPYGDRTREYSEGLRRRILDAQKSCEKRQLFLFDEMDKIPPDVIDSIVPFLGRHAGDVDGIDFRHSIFIFISNAGGEEINHSVTEHYRATKPRESITMLQMESVLNGLDLNSVWYEPLVKASVIDAFVPFLPMERRDVLFCAKEDMKRKGHRYSNLDLEKIADNMLYFPDDLKIFSVSGCKKVSSKVDLVMG
ncbi:torsin-1A-like [Oscarella lobularis]|uniref:torsin-1A-like n=1 Tax=Oscarella lobularis TaxID=121494 RepID=UPI003313E77E